MYLCYLRLTGQYDEHKSEARVYCWQIELFQTLSGRAVSLCRGHRKRVLKILLV